MAVSTLISREFARDTSGAKRLARHAPLSLRNRGRSAYLLLTIENYRRLIYTDGSLAEALAEPGNVDFEFELPAWMGASSSR
jgi:hypothetical protein